MFRQLPKRLFTSETSDILVFNNEKAEENARGVLRTHPLELAAYMEAYWDGGPTRSISGSNPPTLGHPDFLSDEPSVSIVLSPGELPPTVPLPNGRGTTGCTRERNKPSSTSPLGPLNLRLHDREYPSL